MNSDPFFEKLIPYADGALEPAECAQLEAHLAQCPECHAELEQIRALFQDLHDAQPEDPGDVFWQKFRNNVRVQIEASPRKPARRAVHGALPLVRRAALAAALIAAVVTGAWFLRPRTAPEPAHAPAPVKQAKSAPPARVRKTAPAQTTTKEELVIIAALDNAALSHDISPRAKTKKPAGDAANTEIAEPVETFPFAEETAEILAAEPDHDVYIFDDTLTGEYIMPDMLNNLTDEEAEAILQDLESEDPEEKSSAHHNVS